MVKNKTLNIKIIFKIYLEILGTKHIFMRKMGFESLIWKYIYIKPQIF